MGEKFALFYWKKGEQLGGWQDLGGIFDSSELARQYLHSIDVEWTFAHCINLQSEFEVWMESR